MMTRQPQNEQEHRSNAFHELSALVLNIIRSPLEAPAADRRRRSAPSFQQITPAGFASLLLGISLSLMLCGSVTFFIGFVLMPWVLALVVFFYFVGVVSSISMIGKAILCCNSTPPSPSKDAACVMRWLRLVLGGGCNRAILTYTTALLAVAELCFYMKLAKKRN